MHVHTLCQWQHPHYFDADDSRGERNTRRVIALTVSMMIIEIAAGLAFGSMALLADGWHMGTHAAALSIAALAYWYARRHRDNPQYSFGTGKVGALGGFASAIVLVVVALWMAMESVERLFAPNPIRFDEAIGVAVIGLVVNLVSAIILRKHPHRHDHGSGGEHHHDHNLRAAYLHVLADALTSFLAIVALLTGKSFGWIWTDPVMGIVGAMVITRWAYDLLRNTGAILLDSSVDGEIVTSIYTTIESDADNRISDLHIWHVGSGHLAAIVSIVTHYPRPPEHYKTLLADAGVTHVTIGVNECTSEPCLALQSAPLQ